LRCFAVGAYNDADNRTQTLTESWDGTSWSILPSPNVAGIEQALVGIACISKSQCWAIGNGFGAPPTSIIERWNGTSWSLVKAPDPGDPGSQLRDVACASATQCFAVGWHFNANDARGFPLIDAWDGSHWTAVHPPTPMGHEGVLEGVACASSSRCWAVGEEFTNNSTGASKTLVETWNGVSWSVVASPNSSSALENGFSSVSCLAPGLCWAVGSTVENAGGNATLAARWDGSSWSRVPTANSSRPENFLQGVSCASRVDCWAFGVAQDETVPATDPLMEHWNGVKWSVVAAIPEHSLLSAITCRLHVCWAVGDTNEPGPVQTLVLRRVTPTA
jgi:hypothetical protein